jgi:hypothetical protein
MRVQLTDPALMASLLAFLRAHDCVVEQTGPLTLAVWCPPEDRNGNDDPGRLTCRSCGSPVAETLGRLGSLRCHDCRDAGGFETLLAGVYGQGNCNGHAAQARSDLDGYIAEWTTGHPGAQAVIE